MPLIVKNGIDIETKYDSFHPNTENSNVSLRNIF